MSLTMTLQPWVGEKVRYWCKDGSELMQKNATVGSKYFDITCVDYGSFDPWWDPKELPLCKSGLIEVPMDAEGKQVKK